MNAEQAAETLINGNVSDAREWVKHCSKLALLDFIEAMSAAGTQRHTTINRIRVWLE